MAHLVRVTRTHYLNAHGKRVPKGTPGARKVRQQDPRWHGQGVPGMPPKKRVPLATQKAVAKRMLDELVRDAERGRAGLPDASAARRPLAEHLTAFQRDAGLGLASRSRGAKRTPSDTQVNLCVQRVRDLLAGCNFKLPADLNDAAPAKLAGYLKGRVGLPRTGGGISHQTASFYLAAARRFVWWLSVRAKVPVRADLFADVPGFDPSGNRVHARRDVPPHELAAILGAARSSNRVFRSLTGEDRYFLYLTAFSTGYRAGELAKLMPASFDLSAGTATATLPAAATKNGKPARQPLPPGVARQLASYLAAKPAGNPVWPGTWIERPVKMLRADLVAAHVPYRVDTPEGPKYADFHALRHSFLSSLAAAGVGVKELQELARHADPRVTLGVYTHARPEALGASVALLELPGGEDANPFARMTRAELEAALTGSLAALAVLFDLLRPGSLRAPRRAPLVESGGDSGGLPETRTPQRRAA